MKIREGRVYAQIVESTPSEWNWLVDYFQCTDPSTIFSDGEPSNYQLMDAHGRFPAGLLSSLKRAVEQGGNLDGHHFDIRDERKLPPDTPTEPPADLDWLRDYQREAIRRVFSNTCGMLWISTAGGKTACAVGLVHGTPNTRWLAVVHRASLMHQMAAAYEEATGEEAGKIGDGITEPRRFTVATFQTLNIRMFNGDREVIDTIEGADGLICDEVHIAPAETLSAVLAACPAYWRVGLSATPFDRDDRRSVLSLGLIGNVIFRMSYKALVKRGLVAESQIQMVPLTQHYDGKAPTWQRAYKQLVVNSPERNRLVAQMTVAAAKPAFVFVQQVKHGRELMGYMEEAGVNCRFVHGTHSESHRQQSIDALKAGEIEAIVCTEIFSEGIDVPSLAAVVVATGGKSVIAALQRIGRGMRATETKSTFEVWDVLDKGDRWIERHARRRAKAYKREGHDVHLGPIGGPTRLLGAKEKAGESNGSTAKKARRGRPSRRRR